MTEQNLHWLSATEMAASVASNSLSPNEIAEAMIQRVDAVNPSINAIVQFDREQVTRDAAELSRQQESGEKLGPLHGVPFTIKDLTAVDGLPTTFGMKPMADNIATGNAVVVDRLRGAGGLFLGKTNTPESGYYGGTDNHLYGPTHNPWKLGNSAGGSSGGASAAVAAGLGPLAEGSDGAGSVRIPSALCGVVGLKPTTGVIPQTILAGRFYNWAYHGPITRTVADNALMLDIMAGPDNADPLSIERAETSYVEAAKGDVKGLRVAWSTNLASAMLIRRCWQCASTRWRHSRNWVPRSPRRPRSGEIRRSRCGTASGFPVSLPNMTCSTGRTSAARSTTT
ncbi:hypothetical protein N806_07785 [Rhodococcus sp. P27]|nr:hypothetical protein N806_07785 [Rhodococcus sp. P27]